MGNTAVTETSTIKNPMSLTQDENQNTNSILDVLLVVIAALVIIAVLGCIIKCVCSRICTITQVFAAFFLFAVLGFTIKYFCSRISCVQRRVVGIFSYSSPEDYLWITQGLESPMFRGFVEKTLPSIISNNINSRSKYREAVEKCDFAILYHTKNRGRINITNVTDSLYDEEIKHISLCKGRKNVIVVVDDMEKSGYEEKCFILDTQPDISKYARDLILVSSEDKTTQQGINKKLQQIGDLMSDEFINQTQYCDYLSSMARWVYNTIMRHPHQSSGEGLDAPLVV